MRKLLFAAIALAAFPRWGFAISGSQTLINSTGLAYSTAIAQNLQNFGTSGGSASKLSVQVTYASATIPSQTFNGGQESTATITVVSTTSLVAAKATDTLVIPSTSAILGSGATAQITLLGTSGLPGKAASVTLQLANFSSYAASSPSVVLNGQYSFTYNGNWTSSDTITGALSNLVSAINSGGIFTANGVAVSSTVVISLISSGTYANGWRADSSAPTLVSTGVFAGGINPVTITINNGTQNLAFTYGINWPSSGTTTTSNAMSLAGAINGVGGISATSVGAVVYATSTLSGTFANSFTLVTSSVAVVTVSSSNFSGGLNRSLLNAYFSINGVNYRNGYQWSDISNTSTGTIASILGFINGVSTATAQCGMGLGNLTATWSGQTITLTQAIACSAGNAVTLAVSSGSGMTVGGSTFTGGQDNASFVLGGITFQYPTNWNLGASSTTTTTALSIAAAINANSITGTVISATNTAAVVFATSTADGVLQNYSLTSSTVALAVSGFTGGLNPAYSSGTATIAIASHGFTTALPVLFSTGGVSIAGLTNQTTYYVIVIDANDIQLASSSSNALAGTGITITSKDNTASKHTSTLAPLSWTQGPASALWQVSNDGVNWANYSTTAFGVAVGSNTFLAVNPSTTTVQDFGSVDYNYIRYNVTGPTQGALVLKVILTAKD